MTLQVRSASSASESFTEEECPEVEDLQERASAPEREHVSEEQKTSEKEYRYILETMEKVREIAGGDLELAKICVVGNQNQGKSAALQTLTGIEFPEGDGTVTRAAAVVHCTTNESLKDDVFKVQGKQCARSNVAKEIKQAQKALFHGVDKSKKISTDVIKIDVAGPQQMDIIVVDLPGLIAQGEGQAETKELVEQYIKSSLTLVLLVSEAKEDDENVAAIGIVKEFDPYGKRTLRVLTKFDNFDSSKAKEKANALIEKEKCQELGAHALICRSRGNKYDCAVEKKQLAHLPVERAGVAMLKLRLPPIFAKLVKNNFPRLQKEVAEKLKALGSELDAMGRDEPDQHLMVGHLRKALLERIAMLRSQITCQFKVLQEAVHKTEKRIDLEWAGNKMREDAFSIPFFQGGIATKQCVKEVTEWWRESLDQYMQAVRGMIQELPAGRPALVSIALHNFVCEEWEKACAKIFHEFQAACFAALCKEIDFGTANHYLTSKFQEESVLPMQLVEIFINSLTNEDFTEPSSGRFKQQPDKVRQNLKGKLLFAREYWANSYKGKDLHAQQQERVLATVRAIHSVEKKTFTDYILKETRDHVLHKCQKFIEDELITNKEVLDHAVQDPGTVQQRKALKEKEIGMIKVSEIVKLSSKSDGMP